MAINTAWDQVESNKLKTYFIMFLFSCFVVSIVFLFAKAWGFTSMDALGFVGIALIFTGIMNFISYFYSDRIVLAVSGAKPVTEGSNKALYRLVENLCIARGLPMSRIYEIDDSAPNAFATGRDPKHGVICFTTGILSKLSKVELEGVAAHELSHIGNRDTLLMAVVSVLVGIIALLADFYLRASFFSGRDSDNNRSNALFMILALAAAILAPLTAELIKLAVSREREYLADASGVLITRNPEGLISALEKISADKEALEAANRGTAHLYIVNPLKGKDGSGWFTGLFNTHPPLADRVKALEEMGGKIGR